MTTQAKRATVYLEPDLHKALRLKAVETSTSVSELSTTPLKKPWPRMPRTWRRLKKGVASL